MNRGKVMAVLGISANTVVNWRKEGKLKATKLLSGHWDYDDETVYKLAGKL